jgi:hypothetical protein
MMPIPNELVVDKKVFSVLTEECEKVVNTRKRLPDFVFQRAFAKYFAIEHVHIFKQEFASFLLKLATVLEDGSVNYMLLDPDPIEQYDQHSFFGVASFKPASLVERYVPVMSERSVGSLLAYRGNVGAFWGSSLKWGIFCDRISWEMDVIAVPGSVDVPAMTGFRCMDAAWLSDYVRSQYSKDTAIAIEFTRRFLANYSI